MLRKLRDGLGTEMPTVLEAVEGDAAGLSRYNIKILIAAVLGFLGLGLAVFVWPGWLMVAASVAILTSLQFDPIYLKLKKSRKSKREHRFKT